MLTQSAIDPTALHVCRGESSFFFIWSFHLVLAKGARGLRRSFVEAKCGLFSGIMRFMSPDLPSLERTVR
jgi:hypothetical protein